MRKLIMIMALVVAFMPSATGWADAMEGYLSGYMHELDNEALVGGACDEDDRRDFMGSANTSFATEADECGRRAGSAAEAASSCLQSVFPDLSGDCAQCFGQAVACKASHCASVCGAGSEHGSACVSCYQKHCATELVRCTGVDVRDLPQR